MRNILVYIFFITLFSCNTGNSVKKNNYYDTIYNSKEQSLTLKKVLDGKESLEGRPIILETVSKELIPGHYDVDNSYHLLDKKNKNYISSIYDDGKKLKYDIVQDTIFCDIYSATKPNYFDFGRMWNYSDTLLLSFGNYKYYDSNRGKPAYKKLRFKIFIPKTLKINTVLYKFDTTAHVL